MPVPNFEPRGKGPKGQPVMVESVIDFGSLELRMWIVLKRPLLETRNRFPHRTRQ